MATNSASISPKPRECWGEEEMNKNGRRLPQGDAVGSEGNGTTGNCLEGMVNQDHP